MKNSLLWCVRRYQKVKTWIGPKHKTCVFEPTCSEYAIEAVDRFGVVRGSLLAIRRVLRCHPWQKKPGWDPVPKK